MLNKTMAIFLTLLTLLAGLANLKSDSTTTEPVPTTESSAETPPPPPSGERGGVFEPNGLGEGG
jgi:hypothetical protein